MELVFILEAPIIPRFCLEILYVLTVEVYSSRQYLSTYERREKKLDFPFSYIPITHPEISCNI